MLHPCCLGPNTLRHRSAVQANLPPLHLLSGVPGIGSKTAQKIVLDLKDKVQAVSGVAAAAPEVVEQDAEVIAALVSLGYSVVEAQTALQHVSRDLQTVEERLRAALSYLGM